MHVGKPALWPFPHLTRTRNARIFSHFSLSIAPAESKKSSACALQFHCCCCCFRTKVGALFLRAPFGVSEPENCAVLDLCSAHVGAALRRLSAAVRVSTSNAFTTFCCFLTRETIDQIGDSDIIQKAENNAGSRNDRNSEDWSLLKFLFPRVKKNRSCC